MNLEDLIAKRRVTLEKMNYEKIDNAILKNRELQSECSEFCSRTEYNAKRKIIKAAVIATVLWYVFTSTLSIVFSIVFQSDTVRIPLILSIVIITPIAFFCTTTLIAKTRKAATDLIEQKTEDTKVKIESMYAELLHGKKLYSFLGIPQNIIFGKKGFPIVKTDFTELNIYGRFTRYVTTSGKKYHLAEGCSGAYNSVHAYSIAQNPLYTPCLRCVKQSDPIYVPDWYLYYLKTMKIVEEHNISVYLNPNEE